VVEVAPGVHQIDGVSPYCYIVIEGDGSLTLVDTGMPRDGRAVLTYLQANMSKKPSDVKMIVLTHCHTPYVRGASEIKRATGAKLAIHAEDADYLSGRKRMPPPTGAAGVLFRISEPLLAFSAVEPDVRLIENERVGDRLVVLHTPGHTPGSVSLYDRQLKLIFVADTIRSERGKLRGPPAEFTLDKQAARSSLEKLSRVDFHTILGGQGDPFRSDEAPKKVKELALAMTTNALQAPVNIQRSALQDNPHA